LSVLNYFVQKDVRKRDWKIPADFLVVVVVVGGGVMFNQSGILGLYP
jgi:uncharacterized membrane protein YsdA (DUF1294 family)